MQHEFVLEFVPYKKGAFDPLHMIIFVSYMPNNGETLQANEASSTSKTDHPDMTEILLKVV